jgi:hypothetical protein
MNDGQGNIISQIVTGWVSATAAETAVILAIRYLENPPENEIESQAQFVLSAQQCLELADLLTRQANRILHPPDGTVMH